MYLTDFVFDNVKLSMLGYIVGSAVTSNNESASAGSKLELNTVLNRSNYINQIITSSYNEPITVTFDIIKYACNANHYDVVEDTEIPFMMRWLNRTQYCKFQPIYDDLSLSNIYFMGTFTEIQTIQMGGNVIGFTLTFTASTSYGFADYPDNIYTTTTNYKSFEFYDTADEYGEHYINKIILTLTNDTPSMYVDIRDIKTNSLITRTKILNCKAGETITLDGIHKIITSSDPEHTTLYKDFNYVFPKFQNSPGDARNYIIFRRPCTATVVYKPIKKVGIIV